LFPPISYILKGQQFWLTAERCLYWEEEKCLIVSDLHFGKTGHFRREGIAVPPELYKEDLQRLWHQIQHFKPDDVIFVGDLFHSRANLEHNWFHKWRHDLPWLRMHLVIGNHDVLARKDYQDMDLLIHEQQLVVGEFCFVHDLLPEHIADPYYYISGHIHPGIRLAGPGKQSLRFPCFYFSGQFAILPAFSRFTGMALIEPKPGEHVFAIVDNKLIPVNS
jgi:DNA ligase-associated metallophosphoesterase